MKKMIRKYLATIKPLLEKIALIEAMLARKWVASSYKRLFKIQWQIPPEPEFMCHDIDLYYQWPILGKSFWLERGVFGTLAMRPDGVALEIACGDGFNTKNFYSNYTKKIIAVDFDPKAIALAERLHGAPNVEYKVCDVRDGLPNIQVDNVIWDAAIEHFSPSEIDLILTDIKKRLKCDGVLSGYTNMEGKDGKSLSHHEHEFKSKDELFELLHKYFKNVTVFETRCAERGNLYFWASEGTLPFAPSWNDMVTTYNLRSPRTDSRISLDNAPF